ncbi:MAG: aminopeptidase [Bacteroidales bacterium]|nr:aminopeptidase [Bacteroidales bacterium]
MNKIFRRLPLFISLVLFVNVCFAQGLEEKLNVLSEKYSFTFEKITVNDFFTEKYLLLIQQPVDHNNPDSNQFSQRVFLSHLDFDNPVVLITEGYGADYAAHPKYVNELCPILNANQICVEHRYFNESIPEPVDWANLTIDNAASDHHRIVEILKNIYHGKWVNTGISKGGQSAMYHRYFYPDDVDASLGYVCPLNFSIEDKRVYRFLEQVGDSICRQNILNYQIEMLKNKEYYLPEFKRLVKKKNLTYNMEIEEAFDLLIFEYSFAFWQWGNIGCNDILMDPDNPENMVKHLDKVTGIDWISDQGISKIFAFYYQAMLEMGFYGYNIEPFKEFTDFTSNPTFVFSVPDSLEVVYNPIPMQKIDHFIRHEADNMIFIYGETDPWSATAVDLTYNTNSIKIVKPGGSHTTRIRNLPEDQKKLIVETLKSWLGLAY